ncbi:polycomb group RING finger protein 3 [Heptranchias perlo]|uniref:polycomb group RING finger protein 3 n=1 Tax=Heptranchias perlo TaxID=212740 RepID=UPI003559DC76
MTGESEMALQEPGRELLRPSPAGNCSNPSPAGNCSNPSPAGNCSNPSPAGNCSNPSPAGHCSNHYNCRPELKKQKDFYQKLGLEMPGEVKGETCAAKQQLDPLHDGETKPEDDSNKQKTEDKPEEEHDYHRNDEQVSICLECNSSKLRGLKRKWIRCSAQATVLHLKKFIAKKLNLASFNELDILCNEEILGKDHTLKFVVVTRWRFKKSPLLLHYRPKMDLL